MAAYFKIGIILLIVWISLSLVDRLCIKGYKTFYFSASQKLDEAMLHTNAIDIAMFGSSRVFLHNDPEIVDSISNKVSYNFGIDGANLFEMKLIYDCFSARHSSPGIVTVDLTESSFDIDEHPFYNPCLYYPYIDIQAVASALKSTEHVNLLHLFPFLRLTRMDDYTKMNCMKGLMGKKEQTLGRVYKGYQANGTMDIQMDSKLSKAKPMPLNFVISENGKALLETWIKQCKSRNSKMIITYAPAYYKAQVNDNFLVFVENFCKNNEILFLNYRYSEISKDSLLFANYGHLNTKGAKEYSKHLAEDLVNALNQ